MSPALCPKINCLIFNGISATALKAAEQFGAADSFWKRICRHKLFKLRLPRCACVATVVRQMIFQQRAFVPNERTKTLPVQSCFAVNRQQIFVGGVVKTFNERNNFFGDWYHAILARCSFYSAAHVSSRQIHVRNFYLCQLCRTHSRVAENQRYPCAQIVRVVPKLGKFVASKRLVYFACFVRRQFSDAKFVATISMSIAYLNICVQTVFMCPFA